MNRIDSAIYGAACLVLGWGVGTILHECGHLAGAYAFGLPATLGHITLSTGSVIVQGDMTGTQTVVIAVAGSLCLMVAGVLMVRLSGNPMGRMIGVVFLCRAFIDAIPISGMDGAFVAGGVGYLAAWIIVIIEVLISGGLILEELRRTNPLNTIETNNLCNGSKNNIDKR